MVQQVHDCHLLCQHVQCGLGALQSLVYYLHSHMLWKIHEWNTGIQGKVPDHLHCHMLWGIVSSVTDTSMTTNSKSNQVKVHISLQLHRHMIWGTEHRFKILFLRCRFLDNLIINSSFRPIRRRKTVKTHRWKSYNFQKRVWFSSCFRRSVVAQKSSLGILSVWQ